MKEFSNIVKIIPLKEYLSGQSNYDSLISDEVKIEASPTESEAGILYDYSVELYCDKPAQSLVDKYNHPVRSVVMLTDSDSNNYILGEQYNPARVYITPNLNKVKLYISFKTTKLLF